MPAGRPGAHLDPQYAATDSEAADLAPTAAITHDADTGAIGLQTVGNTSSKKCYSCFKTQSRMALDKSLLPLPENVKGLLLMPVGRTGPTNVLLVPQPAATGFELHIWHSCAPTCGSGS